MESEAQNGERRGEAARAPTGRDSRFAGLWLAALILLAYPGVAAGVRSFVFRDYGIFGYPLAAYLKQSLLSGEIPLWNPLSDCGAPFLAQWNTIVCYPFSAIFVWLPLPWSLGLFLLLPLWIAGFGMYRLALDWSRQPAAALLAGVAFVFNGFTISSLIWPHIIAALAWMPWIVLGVARGSSAGGLALPLAALAGAMQMLTGAPELILLTWLLAGALAGSGILQEPKRGWIVGRRLFAVVVLVGGLAAVQLLPFFELLKHSSRWGAGVDPESPMPLTGLANFILPLFKCARTAGGVYFQPDQFWLVSYYVPIGVVALAGLAMYRAKEARVWVLLVAAGLSVWLAAGDAAGLYRGVRAIVPGAGLVNYPVKFVVVAVFALCLLGALGVAEYSRGVVPDAAGSRRRLVWTASGLGLIVVALTAVDLMTLRPYQSGTAILGNAGVRCLFLAAMVSGVVFMPGFGACLSLRSMVWAAVLSAVVWFDAVTHSPGATPMAPPEVFERELLAGKRGADIEPGGASRVYVSAQARELADRIALPDYSQTFIGFRTGLFYNCNLIEGIAQVSGFYPLNLAGPRRFHDLLESSGNRRDRLLDFLGVSAMTSPENPLEFRARSAAMPLATAGQAAVFASVADAARRLADPGFDPSAEVLLPSEAPGDVRVERDPEARVEVRERASHRWVVRMECEKPSMLVIAQSWYPAWRAHVDGTEARIWKANLAFQAVAVPAGNHEVELRYEDVGFRIGAGISIGSVLLLALWMVCAGTAALQKRAGSDIVTRA